MAAVEVERRGGGLAACVRRCRGVSFTGGRIRMRMLVMPQVRRLHLGLVRAVANHRRPAELERKQGQQQDAEPTTHGGECRGGPYTILSNRGMQPTRTLEDRIDELEIKASFTDDLLDQLNLTIYRQQQQIDSLVQQLVQLRRQMPEAGSGGGRNPSDELPPHY